MNLAVSELMYQSYAYIPAGFIPATVICMIYYQCPSFYQATLSILFIHFKVLDNSSVLQTSTFSAQSIKIKLASYTVFLTRERA
jgi:hypothetical protein